MTKMTKTLTAIAAAATLAVAAVAMPQPAQARHGRIAAGIIGGLAVGTILGAAANGAITAPVIIMAPARSITVPTRSITGRIAASRMNVFGTDMAGAGSA